MPRRPPKPAPVVVKRPSEERKRLPPDLEAFARSDEERLRIRKPRQDKGKVNDPREGYTIPGVANRDARAVYDQRVIAMQGLWQAGEASEQDLASLGAHLLDAHRLGLWRARRVMDFAAFAEEVVGVPVKRARALLEAASLAQRESAAQLNERDVALWLRTEAGLHEGDSAPEVRIATTSGKPRLVLSVAMANISEALSGAGVRHAPLARPLEERLSELQNNPRPTASRAIDKQPRSKPKTPAELELDEILADAGVAKDGDEPGVDVSVRVESNLTTNGRMAGGARLLTRKARPQFEAAVDDEADGEGSKSARGRHEESTAARSGVAFERPRRAGRGGDVDRPARDARGAPAARRRDEWQSPSRGRGMREREEGAAPRRRHQGEQRPAARQGKFDKRGSFEKRGGFKQGAGEKQGGFKAAGRGERGGFQSKRAFEKKGSFGNKQGGFRKQDDSGRRAGGFSRDGGAGKGGFRKQGGFNQGSFGEKRALDRGAHKKRKTPRDEESSE